MRIVGDNAIASPHWEACETCRYGAGGECELGDSISLSVFMGDWIVCDDYEPKGGVCEHCGLGLQEHYDLGANYCPCEMHKK